jgi:ferric-dicitrate binding protein FerR (iron transport regulator)
MNKPLHKEAELLFKYWNNQLTETEKRELEEWMEQSADRKEIFEQFKNEAYLQQTVNALQEGDKKIIWNRMAALDPSLHNSKIRRIWPGLAAAAAILIIISTILIFRKTEKPGQIVTTNIPLQKDVAPGGFNATLTLADGKSIVLDSIVTGSLAQQGNTTVLNKNGQLVYTSTTSTRNTDVLYNTLTTSRGQTYPLTLSDQSRVWLNAESSIRFPVSFTGHARKVEVTGEVYFEIAHNATQPFTVQVRGIDIQVLGTTFNVNAYNNEEVIKTTLIEGSVSITKGNQKKQIRPGQQAQVIANEIKISDNVDIDKITAWKKGLFTFRGDKLSDVMKNIARWYNIEVELEGHAPDVEISGDIYRTSNLSEVLKILSALDVESRIEGRKLILKAQ